MSRGSETNLTDYLVYGACAFVAVALGYWMFFGKVSTSDKTVEEFLSNMQTGQYLRVQEALSDETYQNVLLFYGKITANVVKKHYRPQNMGTYRFGLIEKTDKSARYRVDVMDRFGDMTADSIDLVKQEGVWKVSDF